MQKREPIRGEPIGGAVWLEAARCLSVCARPKSPVSLIQRWGFIELWVAVLVLTIPRVTFPWSLKEIEWLVLSWTKMSIHCHRFGLQIKPLNSNTASVLVMGCAGSAASCDYSRGRRWGFQLLEDWTYGKL